LINKISVKNTPVWFNKFFFSYGWHKKKLTANDKNPSERITIRGIIKTKQFSRRDKLGLLHHYYQTNRILPFHRQGLAYSNQPL
jgi:hypothetical protein